MIDFNYNSVLVPAGFSDQAREAVDPASKLLSEPDRVTVLHVTTSLNTFPVGDPAKR